jgi:hypothetical protein
VRNLNILLHRVYTELSECVRNDSLVESCGKLRTILKLKKGVW